MKLRLPIVHKAFAFPAAHNSLTDERLLKLMKNRIVRAVQVEQFGAIRLMKAVKDDEPTPQSGDRFA